MTGTYSFNDGSVHFSTTPCQFAKLP